MITEKLLLCISAAQATAAHWRRGRLVECRAFACSDQGLMEFDSYLTAFSRTPVYVLADSVEEDVRFETLPHATGGDRAQLVKRKLTQIYRATPYYVAKLRGRDESKRRDDRFLFAALTNPELIDNWIEVLKLRDIPIAGVYLASMVGRTLLDKLNIAIPNLLLVAQTAAGLRQTYFHARALSASRLTPREKRHDDARSTITTLSEEITNTRRYLESVKAKPQDEPLSVVVIDHDGSLPRSDLKFDVEMQFLHVDRDELSKRFGISVALLGQFPDALQLYSLGLQAPDSNLARPQLISSFRHHQQRRALYALSTAAAVAAVAWTGLNVYQRVDYDSQTAGLADQTARYQSQYAEASQQFPQAPTSADNLRRIVEAAQKIRSEGRNPEMLLKVVSRALDLNPDIALKRLVWHAGAPGSASPAPIESAPPGAGIEMGSIEGEIMPFNGNYRAALETINRLTAALQADQAVAEVRVEQLPLNINSAASLSGSTMNSAQAATAPFTLTILFKTGLPS
ncbi:MAG: hypothetical protein H0V78_09585 [Burkholderiales bacterium]|nr:hypothetical protein [Burkholderiales bacterium]